VESPLIDIHNLNLGFGRKQVLHSLNLKVGAGETIVLAGPNGCGKSTFLRALMRLEIADIGTGTVLGHSFQDDAEDFNEKIGFVSEMLDFHLPVPILKIAELYKSLRPGFSTEDFLRIANLFQLPTHRPASQYSRGQKMQFAFALAIAGSPQLLFLDEVTAVLDIQVRDIVMREVQRLVSKGSSAIIASNILTEVIPYASRLVIMEDGRIVLDEALNTLGQKFVKIISPPTAETAELRLLRGSGSGLMTYMLPANALAEKTLEVCTPLGQLSADPVNVEDIFLYHCRRNGRV
jgi:ABC-type multidrug transport system ATPase subunit